MANAHSISFIATVPRIEGVNPELWMSYIKSAIQGWGGQFEPNSPLFSGNWDTDQVAVKPYGQRHKNHTTAVNH